MDKNLCTDNFMKNKQANTYFQNNYIEIQQKKYIP